LLKFWCVIAHFFLRDARILRNNRLGGDGRGRCPRRGDHLNSGSIKDPVNLTALSLWLGTMGECPILEIY
jgi:hypothetical protein